MQSDKPQEAAPRRRTRAPETRRTDLMDAAERVFLSKGVAATSVDEITTGADVSKGTFYLYFNSKEALLAALQQRFVDGFLARVSTAMERRKADDFSGRLRAWIKTSLDAYLDQVALHDLVFHEYRAEDRRVMSDNVIVGLLVDLLAAGGAAGAWQVDDARMVAVVMFHAMHGLADDAVTSGKTDQRAPLVRKMVNFCERALRPV